MLTFDASTHTYFWDGVKVPSVTSLINEFMQVTIGGERYHINRYTGAVIPSYLMEEGAAKGSDLHRACQLILQGRLDWDALDPGYLGPCKQFVKWLADFSIEPLYSEFMVYHSRMNYAGCIDLVAINGKSLGIIDLKFGLIGNVSLQLNAYEKAFCSQEKYMGRTNKYVLQIPKSGDSYKFEKIDDEQGWEQFKA